MTIEYVHASKYGNGALWHEIVRVNPGLDPIHLKIGQEIVLPAAADLRRTTPTAGPASRPAGAASEPASGAPADGNMPYVPWQRRQGPAYPGNFWYSFGRWDKEMPETLWDDTKATFTNPWTLAGLGAAGAAGLALHQSPADEHVELIRRRRDPSVVAVVSVSEGFLQTARSVLATATGRRHVLQEFLLPLPGPKALAAVDVVVKLALPPSTLLVSPLTKPLGV
jgi:hypothetical protein